MVMKLDIKVRRRVCAMHNWTDVPHSGLIWHGVIASKLYAPQIVSPVPSPPTDCD